MPKSVRAGIAAAPSKPLEATIFVAAHNARPEVKALADFVCTGSNDDLVIEQAINSLPPSGGRVVLSEGDFILGSSIDILRSNVTLEGQGAGTVIKGAINTSYIIVGNGATALSGIRIANLAIDGTGQTSGHGIHFYGASNYLITNSVIENCWIRRCSNNGIYLYYSRENTITGNNCISNADNGIAISNSSNNLIISNSLTSNGGSGILIVDSNNNTINDNQSRSNGTGIYLGNSNHNVVVGNYFISNGGSGVYIDNSSNYNKINCNYIISNSGSGITTFNIFRTSSFNTMNGNHIMLNGAFGIYLYGSSYNTIVGNFFRDNGLAVNDNFSDIYISTSSNYNTVSGNVALATASNRTRYAVEEIPGCDYNVIVGNIHYGQVRGGYLKSGANTILANNI